MEQVQGLTTSTKERLSKSLSSRRLVLKSQSSYGTRPYRSHPAGAVLVVATACADAARASERNAPADPATFKQFLFSPPTTRARPRSWLWLLPWSIEAASVMELVQRTPCCCKPRNGDRRARHAASLLSRAESGTYECTVHNKTHHTDTTLHSPSFIAVFRIHRFDDEVCSSVPRFPVCIISECSANYNSCSTAAASRRTPVYNTRLIMNYEVDPHHIPRSIQLNSADQRTPTSIALHSNSNSTMLICMYKDSIYERTTHI
jgi:hypothetical protein